MSKLIDICHLTSVHERNDIRIFTKQCISIKNSKSFNVHLVVSDNYKNEIKNSVKIFNVGKAKNRFERIFKISKKIYLEAIRLDCDIYHIHDPELIPVGLKLKKKGKKVIFDSHEDIAEDILTKSWIPFLLRKAVSVFSSQYIKYAFAKFDYIITATPFIKDKYSKINAQTIDINNYPILKEFSNPKDWINRGNNAVYLGVISRRRGIFEILASHEDSNQFNFIIAGNYENEKIKGELKNKRSWKNIDYRGFLERDGIIKILNNSKVGFQIIESLNSYQDAIPIKMLEYMAAEIPVICSNVNILNQIINENKCGIILRKNDKNEIIQSLKFLYENQKIAEQMGKNGRQKILKDWNWEKESLKLLDLYKNLYYENYSNN